ncbi:MAG: polysaccharide deacetylase family protein [Bacillota bacterium]
MKPPIDKEKKPFLRPLLFYILIFEAAAAFSGFVCLKFPPRDPYPCQSNIPGKTDLIWSGLTSRKLAALTFDDGPDPRFTPEILQILHKYKVKATFFVVGRMALLYPGLVKRELKEGHEIGNHTFDHLYLRTQSPQTVEREILKTELILHNLTDRASPWFRPPKGQVTHTIALETARFRKTMILWSYCIEHREAAESRSMVQKAAKAAFPGIIILAHDGLGDRKETVEALPGVIMAYKKMGYRFVTISAMLKASEI